MLEGAVPLCSAMNGKNDFPHLDYLMLWLVAFLQISCKKCLHLHILVAGGVGPYRLPSSQSLLWSGSWVWCQSIRWGLIRGILFVICFHIQHLIARVKLISDVHPLLFTAGCSLEFGCHRDCVVHAAGQCPSGAQRQVGIITPFESYLLLFMNNERVQRWNSGCKASYGIFLQDHWYSQDSWWGGLHWLRSFLCWRLPGHVCRLCPVPWEKGREGGHQGWCVIATMPHEPVLTNAMTQNNVTAKTVHQHVHRKGPLCIRCFHVECVLQLKTQKNKKILWETVFLSFQSSDVWQYESLVDASSAVLHFGYSLKSNPYYTCKWLWKTSLVKNWIAENM